jgi:hypothetical protein
MLTWKRVIPGCKRESPNRGVKGLSSKRAAIPGTHIPISLSEPAGRHEPAAIGMYLSLPGNPSVRSNNILALKLGAVPSMPEASPLSCPVTARGGSSASQFSHRAP